MSSYDREVGMTLRWFSIENSIHFVLVIATQFDDDVNYSCRYFEPIKSTRYGMKVA